MTTTIALGDELVFQGPGTTCFRLRVNPANGQLSALWEDSSTGETWFADTVLRQPGVPGFGYMRTLNGDYFGITSNDPTVVGGALDIAPVVVLGRHVPGWTPRRYDAVGGLVVIGDDDAGHVLVPHYGYMRVVVWDPTPDPVTGKPRGRIDWGTYGADGERMILGRGLLFADPSGNYPLGGDNGDMGPGTVNVPSQNGAGGYFVDGRHIDRVPISFGSADMISAGQSRYYGIGYSTNYPTGAYFLTNRAGWVRNLSVRLPGMPGGTVQAVIQRQYQDTSLGVTLSGNLQNAQDTTHAMLVGPGEAIGLRVTLDGACVPLGSINATFDFGG